MKKIFYFLFFFVCDAYCLYANSELDSLLTVLDKTIANRSYYIQQKEKEIQDLKDKKKELSNLNGIYRLNSNIIRQYESFICDSAELYIQENIEISKRLNNKDFLYESKIQLAFIYSLSGLFVQANDLFKSMDLNELPVNLKVEYCWAIIRYYENLMKYTDDINYSTVYEQEREAYRDTVMLFLSRETQDYMKEKAFKLQLAGKYKEAIRILYPIFKQRKANEHFYAMEAAGLAKVYKLCGNKELEKKFLIIAALTDTKLAVKENEALMILTTRLYEEGEVERAYNYVKAALEDATYYNSRFRNTVIARVYPIIEDTYLYQIGKQKKDYVFMLY